MRVTIKDVAKLAGVAPSTVTRVIQNKSTISEATKERVRSAMKELDYHPNLNARSLVSQSSQVIALVLPMGVMCSSKTPSSLRSSGGLVRLLLIMAMPFRVVQGRMKPPASNNSNK